MCMNQVKKPKDRVTDRGQRSQIEDAGIIPYIQMGKKELVSHSLL